VRTLLRRLAKPSVAAFLGIALMAGGCVFLPGFGGGSDGASSEETDDGIWKGCRSEPRELLGAVPSGFQFHCTTIKVPRDWAKPAGPTMDLALIRVRSNSQKDRIGSLVVNPGGPGGSGVDLAVYLTRGLPIEVLRRFDLIGFDPRGVGRSTPVKCISDADLDATFGADPDPQSQTEFDEMVAMTKRVDDICGDKYGDELRLFSTEQAARDIESIRTTVGDEKLTYLGYSYGTLLGAVYAQLFPTKIRAMVLDGAVDPTQTSAASGESQAKGFERAMDNFSTWCTSHRSACDLDDEPRAVIGDLLNKARVKPVKGPRGRTATPGWIFYAVVSSLYTQDYWTDLADALSDLQGGDASGVFDLADRYAERDPSGHYTNLFDANAAVNCADDGKSPTVDQIRTAQTDWRAKYPLFGAPLAVGGLTCALWPGKRDPYPVGKAVGAPPIVVVGTKGDPATPYEQTATLAEMLGVGTVLTWEGEGHTAYPETRCISNAVNGSLISLKVPEAGLTCPAK
jgi:pimeloyl-ACP methyl ester carboxylesterase